jgi:predicted AlkP superfamily phosphohydrolase/phosphomutase
MSKDKLIVIGLDAATFDLIKPWAAAGDLPNLSRLMTEGTSAYLKTVPNLNSGAAWATFSTGLNPGRHGVFWFYEHRKQDGSLRFLNGEDVHGEPFWITLSRAGFNVSVMNVPMTYPAHPLRGTFIAGLDAPSEDSPNFTYPPDLINELRREVGPYYIDTNIYGYARSGRWDKAIRATEQVINARVNAALYLMRTRPWDVFVVVFTALDRIQHAFWHLTDPNHPYYDNRIAERFGNVVRRFYREIDRSVGLLLNEAGQDTHALILSDHGMGANPLGYQFLDPLLIKLGMLTTFTEESNRSVATALKSLGASTFRLAAQFADGLFSYQFRRRLMRLLPGGRARVVQQLHRSRIDWDRTQAYTEYVNPGIWINLKGRDPTGIVNPGTEYEYTREKISEALRSCRDATTGSPVVKSVVLREEVYQGPHVDRAPDLLVRWNYDVVSSAWIYKDLQGQEWRIDTPKTLIERRNVSGDHHPLGIFIFHGPNVKEGCQINDAHIADVPATILGMLGVEPAEMLDGHFLDEAFIREWPPPTLQTSFKRAEVLKLVPDLLGEEQAMVEERLKNLGYLE